MAEEPLKIDFDYGAARRDGATDAQIADYLSTEVGFDIAAARKDGARDKDIILELSTIEDAPVKAFTRGFAESGSLAAGLTTGVVAGSPLGPPGMIAGGLIGLFTADKLNEIFIPESNYINLGPEAAGETFGSFATPLPIPYILANNAKNLGPLMFISDYARKYGSKDLAIKTTPGDKILRSVQQNPVPFGLIETGSGATSAVFGGGSEASDPGNLYQRLGLEILGGVSSASILARFGTPAVDGITNLLGRFGSESRQYQLGTKLVNALESMKEDPTAALQQLKEINEGAELELQRRAREMGVEPGKLSTATLTQNPVFAKIQNALRKNSRVGSKFDDDIQETITASSQIIDALVQMDDPGALALAAQLEANLYDSMLQTRLSQNLAKASETASKAFTGSPEDAAKAGGIIRTLVSDVLKEARDFEKSLYQNVDRTETATANKVVEAFDEIRSQILPESPLPSLITRFVYRVSGRDKQAGGDVFAKDIENATKAIDKEANVQKKLSNTFDEMGQRARVARDEFEGALFEGNISFNRQVQELGKNPMADYAPLIERLAKISEDYREKGEFRVGSGLDSVTRSRVASLAETKIKQLQSLQRQSELRADVMFLQRDQSAAVATAGDEALPEVSVGDLINFRSEMLLFAREAQAAGNFRNANFYGRMAEGSLEDLGLKATGDDGQTFSKNQQALLRAHGFSRSLNDVFTRAFAGNVVGKNKTAAPKVPPELLADAVMGGSVNATNLRLTQLQDAAKFMAINAGEDFADTSAARLDTVLGATDTMLRDAVSKFYNPETGRVNIDGLNAWTRQNAQALDSFPALKEDLSQASTAYKLLSDITKENSLFKKGLNEQLALGEFLGNFETPGQAIGKLIGEPGTRPSNPSANLNAAMKASRNAGESTFNGLRSSLMDHAYTFAGGTEKFSPTKFREYFIKPMARGQKSVLAIMRDQGMLSDAGAARFNTLLKEISFIENNLLKGAGEEIASDVPAALAELTVRVIGARGGTTIAQRLGMGQSIQVPGYFAQEARNRFIAMPKSYFNDLLVEAAENPKLMELLVRKGVEGQSATAQVRFNNQLNGFLINAGFLPTREEISEYGTQLPFANVIPTATAAELPDAATIESYLQQSNNPPGPVTNTVPVAPPTAPSNNIVPPTGSSRANYSALFPSDVVSPLINQQQQGIGSLFGPR